MNLGKSDKADVKRTTSSLSCIKGKKIYRIITFLPTIETGQRQKEYNNKTLVTSQNPLNGKSLTYM